MLSSRTLARVLRGVYALALVAVASTSFAQGNSGSAPRKYPPIPVNPEVFNAHDEWFRDVAKKIEDGSATTQERRGWYEMKKRYYPFTPEARPPKNWRANALVTGNAIDQRTAASMQKGVKPMAAADYTWTQLGPDVPWGQGQPPAASPNTDFGAGRATAIWVNPNDSRDVLLGFADGGVWKSTNVDKTENSATWTPLTDFQASLSVGDVVAAVSSTDGNRLGPNTTIWVATGEGNFSASDVQGVGVLKSTDGGATWQLKQIPWHVAADGTSMFDRTSIRRIAIDPRNTRNLWIAADSGVFRSNDGGDTWRLVETLPYWKKYSGDCWYIHYTDLIIDDQTPAAGEPSHVYLAHGRAGNAACANISRVDNGIYRSADDGATWTSISTPNANCPGVVAGTTSRGYTCAGSGFAATGLTNSTTVNGNVGRISLAHSASNKKKIYAMVHNVSNSESLGIWSTDNASLATVSWTARSATNYCGGQCWYDMVGAVNPTNDTQVIVGGLEAYVSNNSAGAINKTSTWTEWGTADYAHADHHRLVWVDNTTIYLATDGGFNVGNVVNPGTTGGVDWINQTYNLGTGTLQAYGLGQSASNPLRIHVGTQDNGQPKVVLNAAEDAVTQWWEIRGGDGGFSATNRTNDQIVYQEYVYAGIYRATNATYTGTASWNWSCQNSFTSPLGGCTSCNGSCNPDSSTQFIAPITLDHNNQNILYTASRKVYRKDGTGAWISYSPDLTTTNNANSILWVHSARNNGTGGRLWAVTENGRVWTSANATCTSADCATWSDVTKAPLPNRGFSWIETHPLNGQQAILTVLGWNTGHVFRTLDGGATWVDITGELPNEPFTSIAVDPNDPNRVVIGSDFGAYVWEDAWNSSASPAWLRINNGALPYQKIYQLQWSPASGGKLRAATHGRGIWEMTIGAGAGCGGTVPAAPTGVTATASSGQVTLNWNAVSGATSYKIYRVDGALCPTSGTGRVITTGVTGTTYTDVTSCTGDYSYYVVAMNSSSCESSRSSCASVTMPAASAPTGLTAAAGNNSVSLSWNAVAGAATYEVWREDNTTCPGSNMTQVASNVAGTSFVDTGLVNGTNYAYAVRVQTSCPSAPFSSCATAQPQACTAPGAPTLTSATADCDSIDLQWTAGSGTNASYNVYRADGGCPAGPLTLIAGPITTTSYSDTSAVAGGTYAYVIRGACDAGGGGESADSNCLSATRGAPPAAPTGVTASGSCPSGIDLSWTASSGATTYNVLRGTSCSSLTSVATGVTTTTYNDSTAAAGTDYYYVIQAVGTCGTSTDSSCAGPAAAASDTFRLQVESTFVAGHNDLTLAAEYEESVQQASTENITAAGQYQIGGATPLKWISPAYSGPTDLGSAPWTFDVYGLQTGSGAAGQLYAKVYRYNAGSPVLLFTTGYDDADISAATSQTRFTWTYSPAAGTNVPSGDRMYVEIWVNATAGGGSTTPAEDVATAEVTNAGEITGGNYTNTQSCDASLESIRETRNRGMNLDHVWTVPLTGTSDVTSRIFNLVARVSGGQNIDFSYGTSQTGPWTAMVTINNSAFPACGSAVTFSLPTSLTGNLYIRANRVSDNGTRDTLDVDYLAVATTVSTSTAFTLNYDHSSADSLVKGGKCPACTPTAAPTGVTATASADSEITVAWDAVSGASSYKVYRSDGSCPGDTFTLLASGITASSYVDNTVAGPNAYSYKVTAMDSTGGCESAQSSCGSAVAYTSCVKAPTFDGLSTATASASSVCTIDLAWSAATSNCGNNVTYSIYRSTTAGFTPALSNRIDTAVTGTSYSDNAALLPSTTYYYVVRAADARNGSEETNTVERSATTAADCTSAPQQVQAFTVRSTGDATNGANLLEWLNPAIANAGTTITINYRTDTYPDSPTDAAATTILSNRAVTAGAADSFTHSQLTNGTTYYYAIWVRY